MIRGLIFRGTLMVLGGALLDVLLNIVNATLSLGLVAVAAYAALGGAYIANYCLIHEDEIPTYSARQRDHHA